MLLRVIVLTPTCWLTNSVPLKNHEKDACECGFKSLADVCAQFARTNRPYRIGNAVSVSAGHSVVQRKRNVLLGICICRLVRQAPDQIRPDFICDDQFSLLARDCALCGLPRRLQRTFPADSGSLCNERSARSVCSCSIDTPLFRYDVY